VGRLVLPIIAIAAVCHCIFGKGLWGLFQLLALICDVHSRFHVWRYFSYIIFIGPLWMHIPCSWQMTNGFIFFTQDAVSPVVFNWQIFCFSCINLLYILYRLCTTLHQTDEPPSSEWNFFGWAVIICTLQKQNCRYLSVFSEQWDLNLFWAAGIDIIVCNMSKRSVIFYLVCGLFGGFAVLPHLLNPWCSEVLVLCALVLFECTAVTILAVMRIFWQRFPYWASC
jgi:hypothetical protein